MRVVGEVNKYLTVTEPYKMKDESQRERLGTVLHVAAQCVSDCNTLLSPFLPHAANKVHAVLGGEGEFMPMPRIEQVDELEPDNGAGHTSYSGHHRRLHRRRPRGSRARSWSARRSTSRRRSSPSSTRRSSRRSSPASAWLS